MGSYSRRSQIIAKPIIKLNDVAETVIVRNLRRRPDRLEAITSQLNKLGIDYLVFDAIDHIGTKASATWWNSTNWLQVVRYAKHSKLSNFLTLDDDSLFVDDFNERFAELWPQIPSDWDYVSFGEIFGVRREISLGIAKSSNSWGGHASLIQSQIFDNLLSIIDGLEFADEQINRKLKAHINFYVFSPYLITQSSGFSDHSGQYAENNLFH